MRELEKFKGSLLDPPPFYKWFINHYEKVKYKNIDLHYILYLGKFRREQRWLKQRRKVDDEKKKESEMIKEEILEWHPRADDGGLDPMDK